MLLEHITDRKFGRDEFVIKKKTTPRFQDRTDLLSYPCTRNQNKIMHLIYVLKVYNMLKNDMTESIFAAKDASFTIVV